jgi:DNA (cytosine-5)-methyltransferase 1
VAKARLLGAFCCQGGADYGFALAGFNVTGVDKDPQPRYPFDFIQGDAIEYIREHGHKYDAIAASPPCQHDSDCQRIMSRDHPDLIGPTREALESTGKPWVIENVGGAEAKLRNPVMLCGAMFGLHTYRHRYFEPGGGLTLTAPADPEHKHPTVKMGRRLRTREDYRAEGQDRDGDWYHAVGNFSGVEYARRDMGVPWMNRDGIRECIPPVYGKFIGRQLLNFLQGN